MFITLSINQKMSESSIYLYSNPKASMLAHNMKFKPVAVAPSDVPLQAPFAHGFAIVAQTPPSMSRRLTGCWAAGLGESR